jgi:serine/threonine-protein kinase
MDCIGRYRIVKEIGRGAMGIVYLATDPTIGRSVAIKTVRLREIDDDQQREKLRERLFREARSAGVLSHPNIVTIYDMAEEDGLAYIAMEYVDGPTLDDIMSSGRAIEAGKLFTILRQTALAIDYAHAKGIVHRDIKPANIMLGRDGNVKVTDFGIAKINAAAESFTITGTLVGTPNYMSPEQVQGVDVTGLSDEFSLAVIAYEILTGERPFPGEQLSTVVYKIVAEEPVSPQRLNSTLGPYIDGVLRKGLSKKPENRYRTCAEFIGSLETTCASTKGWKPMARGASLNMSTLSGSLAVKPPVARPLPVKQFGGKHPIPQPPANPASKQPPKPAPAEPRHGSKILPFAAAILMVAGVFSLLTWQGGSSSSSGQPEPAPPKQEDPKPVTLPTADPAASAGNPQPDGNAAATPSPAPDTSTESKPAADSAETAPPPERKPEKPATAKPSSMRPLNQDNQEGLPRPRRSAGGKQQDVFIVTQPAGATAVLDGSGASCSTPCTLAATPGAHSISYHKEGYQDERREVQVGAESEEVPLIQLRRASGTLMLTTSPAGATITINGRVQSQTTPATIQLPPGTYTVMVERNGKRAADRVEIRNGNTNFMKIPLE